MTSVSKRKNLQFPRRVILYAGLLAGTLDILAAVVVYVFIMEKTTTMKILHSIASGVLGKSAYNGGGATAFIGLALHFLIATIFAALFYLLAKSLAVVRQNWLWSGVIFGIFVWAVMNLAVLPITFSQPFIFKTNSVLISLMIIIGAVGIPISYLVNREYPEG